jgi:hypothetical protein
MKQAKQTKQNNKNVSHARKKSDKCLVNSPHQANMTKDLQCQRSNSSSNKTLYHHFNFVRGTNISQTINQGGVIAPARELENSILGDLLWRRPNHWLPVWTSGGGKSRTRGEEMRKQQPVKGNPQETYAWNANPQSQSMSYHQQKLQNRSVKNAIITEFAIPKTKQSS